MRRIAEQPLVHQPGAGWRYGWSFEVLGRVIEVVADLPLDDYLASVIFSPLGMVDSGFYVPPDRVERLAAVYESANGVPHRIDNGDTREITEHVPLLWGGSGCASTAPDFLRFARMLRRRGELDGLRLLKPETVDLMTRNHVMGSMYPIQVRDHQFDGWGYGFGVGVVVEPQRRCHGRVRRNYEWAGSWKTYFSVDPVKELIGIFMAHLEPFDYEGLGGEYWSLVCREVLID